MAKRKCIKCGELFDTETVAYGCSLKNDGFWHLDCPNEKNELLASAQKSAVRACLGALLPLTKHVPESEMAEMLHFIGKRVEKDYHATDLTNYPDDF